MFIIWLYPALLFILTAFTVFSKRVNKGAGFDLGRQMSLSLAFLIPWISLIYFRVPDMWLFSCQGMLALVLLIVRSEVGSDEAWLKGAVSLILGCLFLSISLHPVLGLPFNIETHVAQSFTASSFLVGVYLLFGLPPLQLGVIDLGSEKGRSVHVSLSLLVRYAIGFVLLITMAQSRWMDSIMPLHDFVAGFLLLGFALTRLVLRLQSNIYRMLSYLFSSLVLALVVKIIFPDFGEIVFCTITLLYVPFFLFLNQESPEASGGYDLYNWAAFRQYHAAPARNFLSWLRIFLYVEAIATLALAIELFLYQFWFACACALVASLSSLAVNRDQHAFADRGKALV